jgi:hypothetical protein
MAIRRLIFITSVVTACNRGDAGKETASSDHSSDGSAPPALTLADPMQPYTVRVQRPHGPEGPQGKVTIGSLESIHGSVANGGRVWAGMKAGLRACFNRGLSTDPSQRGTLRVIVEIGPGGEVTDARAEGGDQLERETIACVLRRVRSATFLSPETGSATLAVPMTFDIITQPGPVPR